MKHSKKVDMVIRLMERQYKYNAKSNAVLAKVEPRIKKINDQCARKVAPLQARIDALHAEREKKLSKVRGVDRAAKFRERSRRLEHVIKVRVSKLNGGETAALQAAKMGMAEIAHKEYREGQMRNG